MDAQKLEDSISNLAGRLKMLGASIAALSGTVALIQQLFGNSPKAASYGAAAGLLIHAASTACNEGADLLATFVAFLGRFWAALKPPQAPTAPK